MAKIQFTSRIIPTTSDGVLVETSYLKDEALGKLQSEINYELYSRLGEGTLNSSVLSFKGSVSKYEDLPKEANLGEVYNVISEVTLEDGSHYSPGTNFAWVNDGESRWDALGGTFNTEEIEGKISDISGRLKKIEDSGSGGNLQSVLEEAKNYTDNQLSEHISWTDID